MAQSREEMERILQRNYPGYKLPSYLSFNGGIPLMNDLPKNAMGPYNLPSTYTTAVYTISGIYFFEDARVAEAFASRLISRGEELKVILGTFEPKKSFQAKQDPNVDIQDLDGATPSPRAALSDNEEGRAPIE